MPRYITIPNKMLRDASRALGITQEELQQYMQAGESILDNEKTLPEVLQATGMTRSQLEKDCFDAVIHFIKDQKGQFTEPVPDSLAKKWAEPIG